MKSRIAITKCADYIPENVETALSRALGLLGGIGNFVKPGNTVLLKPNLLSFHAPDEAITTHPEFVRAVIREVKKHTENILLGDAPSVWGRPKEIDEVYEMTGIKQIAEEEKIRLIYFTNSFIKDGYPFTTWLREADCFISLPKFKTHTLTTLTGAVKNCFGLIPGLAKTELHKKSITPRALSRTLADIYRCAKPDLSIVDAITALEADGPAAGGTPRNTGLIIAGVDGVAIDSVLAVIMGLKPKDIQSTAEASLMGLGNADMDKIEILGEKMNGITAPGFILPQTSILWHIPESTAKLAKIVIKFKIKINHPKCVQCGACVTSCPAAAMAIKNRKVIINHKICVLCTCCKETCPHGAIDIEKGILFRIASRSIKALTYLRNQYMKS